MAEGVRYAIVPCSLGRLLVAWTERGVCDVALGDVDDALRDPLGPDAVPGRSPWVDAVRVEVDGRSTADVPLDLHGTPFQRRVWTALRRIPPGETRSYAEIAHDLDLPPTSIRAVGGACAANRVAVLVPCHRVVRADGGLSGYRWGVERKRRLLERERGDAQLSF
jgi:AraC family transcriptional regulator of adaptative response/methylated-DNA-[protein]-cysteine methyltransferase